MSSVATFLEAETALHRALRAIGDDNNVEECGRDTLWECRGRLRGALNQQAPGVAKQSGCLPDLDALLQYELKCRGTVEATLLPCVLPGIAVWRGDISSLKVDCIVNAANSAMLGCFHPNHNCIDNVIHSAAGPQLRDACADLLVETYGSLGPHVPVGGAHITTAFNLPCRYVAHTVGPSLRRGETPTAHHDALLASCYETCLTLASSASVQAQSIAFCCISTGVFRFPQDRAARIAIDTTRAWLAAHPGASVKRVVFNVFLASDAALYRGALGGDQHGLDADDHDSSAADKRARSWLAESDVVLAVGSVSLPVRTSTYSMEALLAARRAVVVLGADASAAQRKEVQHAVSWTASARIVVLCAPGESVPVVPGEFFLRTAVMRI